MIEAALAAADPAKVEAQHGKPPLGEGVIQIVDNLVVHRAAELRMRMQDDGDRRVTFRGRMEPPLQPTGRTIEDDFGHCFSLGACRGTPDPLTRYRRALKPLE